MTKKPEPQEHVLVEFERPDGLVRLKVGVGKNGDPFVDLRNHWRPEDEWIPTRKGVRLHAETLPRLVEALQKADAMVEEMYS